MLGERFARILEGNKAEGGIAKPTLVVPYRNIEEITRLVPVDSLISLLDDDEKLTSLSGIVKFVSDSQEAKTYLVGTSCREDGAVKEGDVNMACNFNNRMGACLKDVPGYVGSAFTDGTYRGVGVSNSPLLARSMDENMKRRASVIFIVDVVEAMNSPRGRVVMDACREQGYEPQRALEEPIWGRGAVCGSVSLRADISLRRMSKDWLERPRDEYPPFVSDKDVEYLGGEKEYGLLDRPLLCGPVCTGAIVKGLRIGDAIIVEPYGELTLVINATIKGAVDLFCRIDGCAEP